MRKILLPLLFLASALGQASAADKIKVTTFSTILTALAQAVGGDQIEVTGLVRAGVDPHEYEPTPADLKQVGDSQLVLASGKHMEGYLTKLKESAGTKGDLVQVGDKFPSLKMKVEEGEKATVVGGMIEDPHWWHSIANMEKATQVVRDELIKLDPAGKAEYDKNAAAYIAKLEALRSWVKHKVAELPRDSRKLVTSHDAFQYFARENGFTIYSIEGVSTEDEPSNKKVSDIIDTIRKQGVKAIFFENIENPKVTKEITRESGAKIGGTLYADGLGTGDASTYEGMMKHNVTTIVDALK